MEPAVYFRSCHNKTAEDAIITFHDDEGNKKWVIPTGQSTTHLIDKKISGMQSVNDAGQIAVIGIEKLTARVDDTYKQMSVLLALCRSEEGRVFTSVVLPPVQMSHKMRTFLDLVETPAPLGINFDAVIEDMKPHLPQPLDRK